MRVKRRCQRDDESRSRLDRGLRCRPAPAATRGRRSQGSICRAGESEHAHQRHMPLNCTRGFRQPRAADAGEGERAARYAAGREGRPGADRRQTATGCSTSREWPRRRNSAHGIPRTHDRNAGRQAWAHGGDRRWLRVARRSSAPKLRCRPGARAARPTGAGHAPNHAPKGHAKRRRFHRSKGRPPAGRRSWLVSVSSARHETSRFRCNSQAAPGAGPRCAYGCPKVALAAHCGGWHLRLGGTLRCAADLWFPDAAAKGG
jgi:hypothetical protein